MFWGCIGPNGVGRLVDATAKSNHRDSAGQPSPVRKTNVWRIKRPFIFQHDNAPPHRAKKTKIYTKLRGIDVLPWPVTVLTLTLSKMFGRSLKTN